MSCDVTRFLMTFQCGTSWGSRSQHLLMEENLHHHEHNKDNLGSNNYAPIFCCQISSRFCRILRLLLLLFIPRADQELVLSQQKVETWLPYFSRSWRACFTDFNKPTESSSSSWWLFSRCLSIRKCSGNQGWWKMIPENRLISNICQPKTFVLNQYNGWLGRHPGLTFPIYLRTLHSISWWCTSKR